jgi:pimeloyl-ACP methyl ester carboxylesterase
LSALLAIALLLLFTAAAGIVYQAVGTRSDSRRFAAPGRLMESGGARVHIQQAGHGAPPVVLEAGIAASSLSWTRVHRRIAEFTEVISYDRPGLGWSAPRRSPGSLEVIIEDLHTLLQHAGVAPKRILVGHSFGGLLVSLYAVRYPENVAGLVLVDPVAPVEWANASAHKLAMLNRGVRLSRRGAVLAHLGVVRLALALLVGGSRVLPKALARISSGRGAGVTERLVGEVRKLPQEVWPMVRSHWCRPGCFVAMAEYLQSLPAAAAALAACRIPPEIPITVLSASDAPPERLREHAAIAETSTRGRHIIASKSGHWILLDEPELVVDAVREMTGTMRS